MFWYTARDDLMFNMIRVISRHQDTQVYGAILPNELTNQEMLDSKAYKEYYAVASGAKPPKAKTKYKKKADGSDTSSKPKSAPTEMWGLKKRLNTSGKVPRLLEVPDEQQQKDGGTDEGASDGPVVLDVPKYKSESEEESWTFSQGDDDDDDNHEHDLNDEKDDADDDDKNDSEETELDDDGDDFVHPNLSTYKADDQEEEKAYDDDEVSSDQKVSTPLDHEFIEEEENQEGDDYVKRDVEMTDAQTNQDTEDVHVTLTAEPPVVQQQSSSVSSDLVSKYINPSPDTGIDSILNQNIQSHNLFNVPVFVAAITPSSVTTIPQPPIPIIQTLQQTPDSTTTTPNPTMTLPLGFEQRVSALETKMSESANFINFLEAVSHSGR
ncbi:hypothetical protein Tco_1095519 [Tanacetum coccineum]